MSPQIAIESPPTFNRRMSLLTATTKLERSGRVGEVAAGTAADCMAVCCCCPCALMNLVILALYRVPRNLCRKAWNKMKRRRRQKRKAPQQQSGDSAVSVAEAEDDEGESDGEPNVRVDDSLKEVAEMEKEMWDRFYGAGFWRSDSRRHD